MVCKDCNSYVHNRNDMTLLHLNKCFNGKFNDDHCSIENYLYCFSCKTITSIHNNISANLMCNITAVSYIDLINNVNTSGLIYTHILSMLSHNP